MSAGQEDTMTESIRGVLEKFYIERDIYSRGLTNKKYIEIVDQAEKQIQAITDKRIEEIKGKIPRKMTVRNMQDIIGTHSGIILCTQALEALHNEIYG